MAVQFYVEQADRASQSGVAAEQVYAGELVHSDAGSVTRFAYADSDYDGLAVYDPEFMAAEDEDAIADESVESGDLVRFQPDEDAAVVHIRTIEETTSGVTSAPSIEHETVVGVVDSSDADAGDFDGRIVEEGYSNDENDDASSTTFSRANNNFLAIGEAYRPAKQNGGTVTDYDTPVRVQLYGEAKS